MRFYGRKEELRQMEKIGSRTEKGARMTVLTGRRRVGKTSLALEFSKTRRHCYLFVSKKTEPLLCQEMVEQIRAKINFQIIGEVKRFQDIFKLLLEHSKNEELTLIIDEFQEFLNVNPSVFSEIQHLWDLNKNQARLHLICVGSIYSMMRRIFEERGEPLFGRADRIIHLKPFSLKTVWSVLKEHANPTGKTLLDAQTITGGMPKYVEYLVDESAFSYDSMMKFVFHKDSPLLNEGRNLLVEELGKEYGTYFSILELISTGKTSRNQIQSVLETDVGGHLDRLEKVFSVISKHKPINAKPNSRRQRFRIDDNFLGFWFRFIYRQKAAIEMENFDYAREIVDRDFSTYQGIVLEKCFRELFAESGRYNQVGGYWEKAGQNEIDLIALNDLKKQMVLGDVKLNRKKISLQGLRHRARNLMKHYPDYQKSWLGLSMDNLPEYASGS